MIMCSTEIGGSQRGDTATVGALRRDTLCGHLRAALALADEGGDILLGAKLQDVLHYAKGIAASSGDDVGIADRPD